MHPIIQRSGARARRLTQSITARQAALVAGANGMSAALRLVVVLLLAGVLTRAEYGYLGVFVVLLDTASVVCESGLHPTLVRFLAGKGERRAVLVRRALAIKAALVVICVGMATLAYGLFLSRMAIPGEYAWMYPAAIGAGILLSFHMFSMSLLQALQRFGLYAALSVSINALRLIILGGLILAGTASFELLAGLFLAAPAVGALLGLVLALAAWRGADKGEAGTAPTTRNLLAFMLPLAAVQWLVVAIDRGDVLFVQALTSAEETGGLVLAKQAALIFPIIAQALWTVLLPKVAAMEDRESLRRYRRRVLALAPVFLALGIAGIFAVPPLLNWLLDHRYAGAMPTLMVLYLSYGIVLIQNPLGLVLYAANRVHLITLMHAIQLPVFFACCAVLVPWQGALGAALAYLVIHSFALVYMLVVTARALHAMPPTAEP